MLIAFDQTRLEAAGFTVGKDRLPAKDGAYVPVTLPGETHPLLVFIDAQDRLALVTERSAAHRIIAEALGATGTERPPWA